MNFTSDNAAGASTPILDAIVAAAAGTTAAYGADDCTARALNLIDEVFERECATFLVTTGTAANALALGSLAPPWGAIFCHEAAHVIGAECGAPEMFTGGAKLVGIAAEAGKLTPEAMRVALAHYRAGAIDQVQPAALSLSQASECGTVYACDEIARIAEFAHGAGMGVHMDGARFANALVGIGCAPAQMTWKAGVDVLSFGATKNGGLACEAIVFFDPAKAPGFAYRRKRGGHTLSKGRFLGAQMAAYLEGGHWLQLARHANQCAARLSRELADLEGVRVPWRTQANAVFALLPKCGDVALKAAGANYFRWDHSSLAAADAPASNEVFIRLVCSFATESAEVDRAVAVVRQALRRNPRPNLAAIVDDHSAGCRATRPPP